VEVWLCVGVRGGWNGGLDGVVMDNLGLGVGVGTLCGRELFKGGGWCCLG